MKQKREKLKSLRLENKMTLQEVANKVGITKVHYLYLENGERGLSYDMAIKISSVFGLKPDDIFLDSELTKTEQKPSVS